MSPNMAMRRTGRPRIRSRDSLGSPLSFWSLGRWQISAFCLYAGVVALCAACVTGRRIPNASMFERPGRLRQLYETAHPQPEPQTSHVSNAAEWACLDPEPKTGVTEIALERTGCYGFCPTYTVTLHATGSAEFVGQANVRMVGRHDGSIDSELFESLARLAVDIGFFDSLSDHYDCPVTDNPTVYVSLVRDGTRKTIKHYAPDRSGPARLQWFEDIVDLVQEEIKWR